MSVNVIKTKGCPLCEKEGPRFDFARRCCRVRFLVGLPDRTMRAGWLARWEDRLGKDAIELDRQWLVEVWPRRHDGVGLVLAMMKGGDDGER